MSDYLSGGGATDAGHRPRADGAPFAPASRRAVPRPRPLIVDELFEIIRRINRAEGAGILLVEQNAQMALEIADHGYVMESGRIVLDVPAGELAENRNVREFSLGLTTEGGLKSYRDVKHYVRRKRWFSS